MATHLNRRDFLTAASAASAAARLGACADEDDAAPTSVDTPDPEAASNVPTAALITRWRQDPFAFGSYSSLRPGSSPADREALGASVDGRMFFAGEACSLDYPATVHGALLSGRDTADAVAAASEPGDTVLVIGAGAAGLGAAEGLPTAELQSPSSKAAIASVDESTPIRRSACQLTSVPRGSTGSTATR
jgi:hypothetical protein